MKIKQKTILHQLYLLPLIVNVLFTMVNIMTYRFASVVIQMCLIYY